jgi:hypothetical protein
LEGKNRPPKFKNTGLASHSPHPFYPFGWNTGVPELRPILIACGLSLHWDLQSLIPREPKWMPLGPTIIAAIPRDRWQIEPYDPEQLTFMWYPKLP